ncbi:MAG: OmpA family protein, partial [Bacteroidales bacterium]
MKKLYIYILLIVCPFTLVIGQKNLKEIKGDNFYKEYSYTEAIKKYTSAGSLTVDGFRKLAESYRNMGNFADAEESYRAFINKSKATHDDWFNFALVLKTNGKYDEANTWLMKFAEVRPNDLRTQNYLKTKGDFVTIQKDQGKFSIEDLALNTADKDFAPTFFKESIVFSSSREGIPSVVRKYNWDKLPFLNLFQSDISADGELSAPYYFNTKLNKKWHEGTTSFSNNGTFLAFTRDNYDGKGKDGVIRLEIFFSTFDGRRWSNPVPFVLNSPDYSVGHPCLTEDGNTLYFASDVSGGYGGVDLYRIRKDEKGEWGKEENLGPKVNTEGNEMFPFYEEKSKTLFYASNGLNGLGGLDIYYSRNTNNSFSEPKNLGAPINSPYDDFSLIINKELKKGYFTSNREGGAGDDDIYSFLVKKQIFGGKKIIGVAKDRKGRKLVDTEVSLLDENQKVIATVKTLADGAYEFEAEANKLYSLSGVKPKYTEGSNQADTHVKADVIVADVVLDNMFKKLIGTAKDKSGEILSETVVKLTEKGGAEIGTVTTTKDGKYAFDILANKQYNLVGKKPNYFDGKNSANSNVPEEVIVADVVLQDLKKDRLIKVDPIYFDLSKWNIRPDAAKILDQIVAIMNEYPTLEIELGSHTDCRSSFKFNMDLSTKRAKASADYIKQRITRPERIYGKGYGESQLLTNCPCEGKVKSNCSEEDHQKNRRT